MAWQPGAVAHNKNSSFQYRCTSHDMVSQPTRSQLASVDKPIVTPMIKKHLIFAFIQSITQDFRKYGFDYYKTTDGVRSRLYCNIHRWPHRRSAFSMRGAIPCFCLCGNPALARVPQNACLAYLDPRATHGESS